MTTSANPWASATPRRPPPAEATAPAPAPMNTSVNVPISSAIAAWVLPLMSPPALRARRPSITQLGHFHNGKARLLHCPDPAAEEPMRFEKSFIPYGAYWSTPFCKWQGSLSHLNAIPFAARVAAGALAARKIDPARQLDGVVVGMTIPQKHGLYAAPWLAALLGGGGNTGTLVSQACATGARTLATAAAEVEVSGERTVLAIAADRCSNGPHVYYPNPLGPGGTGDKEDIVLDSFGNDPWARNSMIQTAENVAAEAGFSREAQDETTLVRFRQYQDALADDAAFHRRFLVLPLEVPDASGRKIVAK